MRQDERKEWRKLKGRLFRPTRPSMGEDAFVRAVMARIPETSQPSFLDNLSLWFKIPALAFAATLLLTFLPMQDEPSPSMEGLLTANIQTDELMGFYWEDL